MCADKVDFYSDYVFKYIKVFSVRICLHIKMIILVDTVPTLRAA
ncbi:hypothetical protein SAMN05216191_11312 [Paenibacillus jilunlii]|uniref:Uncharacterized protein n=1 Tax=Paenibacillus jilunlii TaxID=682956 RepID=A0A1G9TFW8_9BACL|nr:hypothetical protein SAMN05216191_11312 [Paenibacillus jilunlii]